MPSSGTWRRVDIVNRRFGGTYRLHLQGIRNPRARNQREQVAHSRKITKNPQKRAVFKRTKTVHALDLTATLIGIVNYAILYYVFDCMGVKLSL
jgi:hypothetical protein